MDVVDAIKRRRSIPRFTSMEVEDAKLDLLIDLARAAPSAYNRQPWFFYVVKKVEIRNQIRKWFKAFKHIQTAPVIIVACADRNSKYYIHDCCLAIGNIMLAAVPLGLGTHWTSPFKFAGKDPDKGIRDLLKIPPKYSVISLISIGYPDQQAKPKDRKLKDIKETIVKV